RPRRPPCGRLRQRGLCGLPPSSVSRLLLPRIRCAACGFAPGLHLAQLLGHIPPASHDVFLDKPWVLLLKFGKDSDTIFRPFAQKDAIMEIGQRGLAKFLERLVIASAPANPADPASLADRLIADLDTVDEFRQPPILDSALLNVAILMLLDAGEAMAQIDVAIAVDVQQSQHRPAGEH